MLLFARYLRSVVIRFGIGLIAIICFVGVAMSVSYAFKAAKAPRGEPVAVVEIVQPDKKPESAVADPHVRVSADKAASAEAQMASLLSKDDSLTPLLTLDGTFDFTTAGTFDATGQLDSSDPTAAIGQTLPAEAQLAAGNAGVSGFANGMLGGSGGGGGSAGGGRAAGASADGETSGDGSDGESGDGEVADRVAAGGQAGSASPGNGASTPGGGASAGGASAGVASSSPSGSSAGPNGSSPGPGGVLPGDGGLRSLDSGAAASSDGPVSVPEPASLLLAALGFSLMASKLRHRPGR
jgi:hypothetical protein